MTTEEPFDLSAEIFRWASGLPLWQQHLLRRVAQAPLDDADVTEVADEVAAAFGVGHLAQQLPISEPELGLARVSGPHVALTRLGHLSGVGVVATGQELTFGPTGLTIVYGANAAGKSSYVRVLKHACRSVDRRAQVLSNVFAEGPRPRRTAKVDWSVDGQARAQEIDLDRAPPGDLSGISVLDTRCAAVYVAGNDVIAYVPSALHVFKRLADAQGKVRRELSERAARLRATRPDLAAIPEGSSAHKAVSALDAETDPESVRALAAVTDRDRERLAEIERALALDDPVERQARARRARADAADASLLAAAVARVGSALAPEVLDELALLRAEALAATVISESWRALWDAARTYCDHEGVPFPPAERCPLCEQDLGAAARARFEALEDEGARRARAAAARRDAAQSALGDDLLRPCRPAFLDTLGVRDGELYGCVVAWVEMADARRRAALAAQAPPALSASPENALREWAQAREAEARALELAADPAERAVLSAEARDLRGRIALAPRVGEVIAFIGALTQAAALDKAHAALGTAPITTRQGALTDRVLTRTLRDKLNEELVALGLEHARVDVDRYGAAGASQVRMSLTEAKQSAPLADVLSEGEQGAIALAFFLAELGAAEHENGVVFDDPVSSLDLERRRHIARRLCEEASRRQVIVFTHDLPFLVELRDHAAETGVEVHHQTIWRSGDAAGRVQNDAPLHVLSVVKRLGHLADRLAAWPKPEAEFSQDDAWNRVKSFYNDLRDTWEMAVEEKLLNGAVQRFSPQVQTKRLAKVTISDEDKAEIELGMTRTSKYLHSQPAASGMTLPRKDELVADLELLRAFVKRKDRENSGG